jgi:DNA replication protein DnaC
MTMTTVTTVTTQELMMSKKTQAGGVSAAGAANLPQTDRDALLAHLTALRLPFALANYLAYAQSAADKQWSHVQFLQELMRSEALARADRRVERLVAQARFPVLKTLERFDWEWPAKINRMMVQNLFHLDFVRQHSNVVFIAGTGLGKSHLMTALGHAACLQGYPVLFTGAIEIINTLALAHATGSLKRAMAHYVKPQVLCIDELGYLPIDKFGADCLFQIISHRYERGATLITTNRVYKHWAEIFNNDAVLTSALLDRVTHHAQTVLIEGQSYRSRDQVEL